MLPPISPLLPPSLLSCHLYPPLDIIIDLLQSIIIVVAEPSITCLLSCNPRPSINIIAIVVLLLVSTCCYCAWLNFVIIFLPRPPTITSVAPALGAAHEPTIILLQCTEIFDDKDGHGHGSACQSI